MTTVDERHATRVLRVFPRALMVLAVAGFSIALFLRTGDLPKPKAVIGSMLVLVYLAWIAAELPVTFRRSTESLPEFGTLVPYGTARFATALSAVLIGTHWPAGWSWWQSAPAALFLAGVGLRLIAVRKLGRFYSHHVERQDDHLVVTTGPYAVIRHPAYAGMLLSHAGLVAFFANPVSIVLLVGLLATIVWRILVEERTISDIPGYRPYAEQHSRLVPGVW